MKDRTKSKVKQVILSIAIALVLVFFVAYGIGVFYEQPKYENFCNNGLKPVYNNQYNQSACEMSNGTWNPSDINPKVSQPCYDYTTATPTLTKCPEGYCDLYFKCNQAYQDINNVYNRNVFIVSLVLGILIILLGVVLKLESVSAGIMGGGVLLVLYGVVRYWGELGKYLRLSMLGIVLVLLIWIGYKKFGKK